VLSPAHAASITLVAASIASVRTRDRAIVGNRILTSRAEARLWVMIHAENRVVTDPPRQPIVLH
jgi:hypothetical protein